MDFTVHWPGAARRDLKRITDYLTRTDADAIPFALGPIIRKIESLADFPYSGDVWERTGTHEFRVIAAGSYRAFFELDPDERLVTIQKILHVRQQDPEFPE